VGGSKDPSLFPTDAIILPTIELCRRVLTLEIPEDGEINGNGAINRGNLEKKEPPASE